MSQNIPGEVPLSAVVIIEVVDSDVSGTRWARNSPMAATAISALHESDTYTTS